MSQSIRNPFRVLWLLEYGVLFLWECIKANLHAAYRVLHPNLPVFSGTIRVKTGLQNDTALMFLAGALSFTAGNLSVDIDKEKGIIYLYRSSLDKNVSSDPVQLPESDRFENILRRVFE